ncbi:MAG: hypothetical protein NTU95_05800 [Methanothrix sp.]|nr:hypothetical protein [Methanothrix sp.]
MGNIDFGGSLDDDDGSVALVRGKLVGDQAEGLLLWTHPTWVSNGYIEGVYDLTNFMIPGRTYTPNQRDHISGEYGLFPDSCYGIGCIWCGDVTFKIIIRSQGIPDFTLVGPTRLNCEDTHNAFDAYIPSQFTGRPIKVVLRVDAGDESTLDHAGWKDVVLSRG